MLTVRFDGAAVRSGAIPMSHLIYFLANMNKALRPTARLVQGGAASLQRGQPPVRIREEVDLDLVLLTHGSSATVLGFDRRPGTQRARRQALEMALRDFIVVPYDHEIARCYGRLVAERQREGRPIAWIAACAVRHGIHW